MHRHGLVHRDIKPSNIIFVNGIPKLADIGLVARAEATLSLVGTEGYLPPEGPGTAQADIFSLGKVLYEMATGRDRQEFPELPTNLIAATRRRARPTRRVERDHRPRLSRRSQAALPDRRRTPRRPRAAPERQIGQPDARGGTPAQVRGPRRGGGDGVAVLAGCACLLPTAPNPRSPPHSPGENQALAEEKTKLADNLTKLAEENRQRIVRLRHRQRHPAAR